MKSLNKKPANTVPTPSPERISQKYPAKSHPWRKFCYGAKVMPVVLKVGK